MIINVKPMEIFNARLSTQLGEVVTDLLVQLISLSVRITVVA